MTHPRNGYYIAVDGGGSKTEFCAYDIQTGQTWCHRLGSSNYKISENNIGKEIILNGVHQIFEEMDINEQNVSGLVMGMSGVDSPDDHMYYMDIASATKVLSEKIYICNDSELAFYSRGVPPGLCIIAGTGSIATGVGKKRQKVRAGGWGSPISDEGSGGWIGIKTLRDVLRYCDGYGEYQEIFAAIRDSFNVSSFGMLPKTLSQISMPKIAEVAKIVMDEADKGEDYCSRIVIRAAELVAQIAYAVYYRLDFRHEQKVDIVMGGSLYKSPVFTVQFKQALARQTPINNLHFCEEVSNPVSGGIVLAHILFGEPGLKDLATIINGNKEDKS